LIAASYQQVTVLDLSKAALSTARARLGGKAAKVTWVVVDVTAWEPDEAYDVWHDRAAFHFLTEADGRTAYLGCLTKALRPDGYAIIGTFAPDGPERCSGLPVMCYDAAGLGKTLGNAFELAATRRHVRRTPAGGTQSFQFSVFRRAQT
jgi:SAM-dependent methyltransferase